MNEFRSHVFGGPRSSADLLGTKRPRGARGDAGLQSVAVPRSESRKGSTRGGDRHRLAAEKVTITHAGKPREVELVNLSSGGAMLAGDFSPNLWDPVDLHLDSGMVLGCVVRWIKGGRVGLQFAPETAIDCSPGEMRSLLSDVVARSFPDLKVDVGAVAQAGGPAPASPEAELRNLRSDHRIPLLWKGTLHYDFTSTPIFFRNISRTGALVRCDLAVPIGAEPLIDIGESASLFATVSWRRENQVGLRFKEPFDVSLLARSRPDIVPFWERSRAGRAADADEPFAEPLDELRQRLEGFMKR